MFKWFLSKNDDFEDDIPEPPKPNKPLAIKIKNTIYDPSYYFCLPDHFKEDLISAYEARFIRKMQKDQIDQELNEIRRIAQIKHITQKIDELIEEHPDLQTSIDLDQHISEIEHMTESEASVDEELPALEPVDEELPALEPVDEELPALEPVDEELPALPKSMDEEPPKSMDEKWSSFEPEIFDWDTKIKEWGLDTASIYMDWHSNEAFEMIPTEAFQPIPEEAFQPIPEEAFQPIPEEAFQSIPEEMFHTVEAFELIPSNSKESDMEMGMMNEIVIVSNEEEMAKLSKEIGEWGQFENVLEDKKEQESMSSNKETLPEHPEGYLEIFMGPMFSGKSTKAFFKLSSMADQRFRCLYINSYKDCRKTESKDEYVSTHNSSYSQPSPKITCVKVERLAEVDVTQFEYIAVDELQFFEDAYETIVGWVNSGKYVIVASLDGDCYRRKFGCVLDLIPHANEVTKLNAYCDICRDNYRKLTPAPFTARMTSDKSSELVGGKDLYKAMCRACHDFHLDVTVSYI